MPAVSTSVTVTANPQSHHSRPSSCRNRFRDVFSLLDICLSLKDSPVEIKEILSPAVFETKLLTPLYKRKRQDRSLLFMRPASPITRSCYTDGPARTTNRQGRF